MATERRPYHRTADSVIDELWTNDQLAFITRLSALFHTRWRTERLSAGRASWAVLGHADLMRVAGKLTVSSARALAEQVSKLASISFITHPTLTVVEWYKWSEFQGLVPQNGEQSGQEQAPSASSVQRPASSVPKKSKSLRARRVKTPCPDRLDEADWERLKAWCLAKHPALYADLPAIWDRVVSWARSKDVQRPGWYATAQTFVQNRAKENDDAAKRPFARNGRRQTALEAGTEILAEFLGSPGADSDVH